MLLSTGIGGVVTIIGGIVDSVVVEVVVVGSGFALVRPPPIPAAATVSFDAVDFRFLASMGLSDLLKAPAAFRRKRIELFNLPSSVIACLSYMQQEFPR